MRSIWFVGVLGLLLAGLTGCASWQLPAEELVMYGGQRKTPEQHAADSKFVQETVQKFGTLQKGSNVCAERGWRAFYQGNLTQAMKCFNQTWLLDQGNPQAYWGFGAVSLRQGNYREGLDLLAKAYNLDPTNPRIVSELAYAYALNGRGYLKRKNEDDAMYLRLAEEYFRKASRLDPVYPLLYSQWAEARYYQRDWPGAWERVMKAQTLGGGGTVHPELIQKLSEEMPNPYASTEN
jgi:tetratricopeptide (TPR) repeat protein